MNIEQLQKQLYKFVRLRESATCRQPGGGWTQADWLWQIVTIDKKDGRVELEAHQYKLTLMSDHIKNFMRSTDPTFDGFLLLRVSVLIEGTKITIEPILNSGT